MAKLNEDLVVALLDAAGNEIAHSGQCRQKKKKEKKQKLLLVLSQGTEVVKDCYFFL